MKFVWRATAALAAVLMLAAGCSDDRITGPDGAAIPEPGKEAAASAGDLAITRFEGPATVTQGETLVLAVTLANVGADSVTVPFTGAIVHQGSGAVLFSRVFPGLSPGGAIASDHLRFDVSPDLPPGLYTLQAGHDLVDADPTNDTASIQVEVLPAEDFLFELTVQDGQGRPAADVEARLHVRIPEIDPMKPASSIRFQVPQAARVTLYLSDLEGAHVRTLLDGMLVAGMHEVRWDGKDDAGQPLLGTVVAAYTLEGRDDAGGLLYSDTKWLTMYTSPDFEQRPVLGVTAADGVVATQDRLLFPFLYDLPDLVMTNEVGEIVGKFTISPIVTVTLTHKPTGAQYEFDLPVGQGINRFTLGPGGVVPADGVWSVEGGAAPRLVPVDAIAEGVPPPVDWELYQNYPNPFN